MACHITVVRYIVGHGLVYETVSSYLLCLFADRLILKNMLLVFKIVESLR